MLSLAGNNLQTYQPPKVDTSSLLKNGDSLAKGYAPQDYTSPEFSKFQEQQQTVGGVGDINFFDKNNSFMDNTGQVMGLAGAGIGLADMLNNWGMQKKAMNLNMDSVRQTMGNNQEAFDRSKGRQDRSLAAVNSANSLAQANQGLGG